METVDIPKEIMDEARADKWIGKRLKVHPEFQPRAIMCDGEVAGFMLPGRTSKTNEVMTGSLFIGSKFRKKGLAEAALRAFAEENPNAVSFVNENNTASRAAHRKAGWADTKRRVQGNRKATVWTIRGAENAYNTGKQAALRTLGLFR